MQTKKDFETIGRSLYLLRISIQTSPDQMTTLTAFDRHVQRLETALAKSNPKFDRKQFEAIVYTYVKGDGELP